MSCLKKSSLARPWVALAMFLLIQGCSSSQVEESADPSAEAPAEEAAIEGSGEAATDAVPPADPASDPAAQEPAPDALAASEVPPPPPPEETPAEAPVEVAQPETPIEEAAPVADAAPAAPVSGELTSYRVRRGDTLMKISFEKFGDVYRWREILDANQDKLRGASELTPGTELLLPGVEMVTIVRNGEEYLIKKGDTLGLISNEVYGTPAKWKKLWKNNRQLIKNPNRIYAGFSLYYIPEARISGEEQGEDSSASVQSLPFKGSEPPAESARAPASTK